MRKPALVAVTALVVAATAGALVAAPAALAKPAGKVICTQVPQKSGVLDHEFIAQFMSEHIAHERSRFQTVQGVSTVLCAY